MNAESEADVDWVLKQNRWLTYTNKLLKSLNKNEASILKTLLKSNRGIDTIDRLSEPIYGTLSGKKVKKLEKWLKKVRDRIAYYQEVHLWLLSSSSCPKILREF